MSLEYFRQATVGALRYAFNTGRMEFPGRWLDHERYGDISPLVKRDDIHGLIVAAHDAAEEARFADLEIPVVNISNSMSAPRIPVVTQDDVSVGRLAAEHLIDRGCRNFAFWGDKGKSYSDERLQGFRQTLGSRPLQVKLGGRNRVRPHPVFKSMKAFMKTLPPKTGLFATLDDSALYFLRAARELGRSVPDDIAVLGAGDDDFLVEIESVPLSSIRLPAREIGYQAAALLDEMIEKDTRNVDSIRLPVHGISERHSTDALQFEDPVVTKVMRYLRDDITCQASDLIAISGVSRSGLQTRFRAAVGRSLLEEIHRARISQAKHLLATSDLTLENIADRVGFNSAQRLHAIFTKSVGTPPGVFRTRNRAIAATPLHR